MADYFSQMVVRPAIPKAAMTELEHAILGRMFEEETVGEDVYFCAAHGPNDFVMLNIGETWRMLAADEGTASSVSEVVRAELAGLDPKEEYFDLDMSVIGFEGIFEDIVKRSALDFVEIETAWTCSRMRPDGFGGAATLISKTGIVSMSTAGFLEEAIATLSLGPPPD